jgi:hypothetical protein
LHIGVAELLCDEFIRRAGTNSTKRVEMPRVVYTMVRESQRPESIAVHVAHLPARDPEE